MPPVDARTNHEWLAQLAAPGAEGARAQRDLRALVVKGLSRALAGRSEAAGLVEDFAHDAVLRILDNLHTFRDESRFSTWALAVALRVAFSEMRRRRFRGVSFEDLSRSEAISQDAPSPERTLVQREIIAALDRCLQTSLTDRQRAVIVAELRGIPQDVIAERLAVSRNALYKLGHDARRAMQRALEQAGFDRDGLRAAFEEP